MKESLILLLAIILSLIIFGIVGMSRNEHFSPTGWTQNCPAPQNQLLSPKMAYGRKFGWKRFGDNVAGSYSPGSVFQCKNPKQCSMINVRGCPHREDIPHLKEDLPLGWGSTITGPWAQNSCMSNVNGINKASMRNPYGKVGQQQTYGFCEKGINNFFSD